MTTDTTAEVGTLTREQIKAALSADCEAITLHMDERTIPYAGSFESNRETGELRIHTRPPIYGERRDITITIPVEVTLRSCLRFGDEQTAHGGYYERKRINAYAYIPVYQSEVRPITSVFMLAKPGDRLALRFVEGNTNETMVNAGLTADEAYVILMRGEKSIASFLVDYSVCPVTSTARTVRRNY